MLRRCLRPLIPQLLTLIRPCLQADNVLDKSKRTQCPLPLPGCKRSTAQAFQYFKLRHQFRSANQRKERNHLVRNGRHLVHIRRIRRLLQTFGIEAGFGNEALHYGLCRLPGRHRRKR